MPITDVTELSGSELLDRVDVLFDRQRRAEVEILELAAQWAVLHNPDTLDPEVATLPGREKARRFGGHGTPEVAEFAAAELGARLRKTPYAARELIADALDLMHRFPRLWARVEAFEVDPRYARYVTRQCRDLTSEQAAYVDERVVESADGRLPWTRFEQLVAGAIVGADPEAARVREEKASQAVFAKRTPTDATGMAMFLIRADLATIEQIDAAVTAAAARLDGPEDERRVEAVLLLVHGRDAVDTADLLPTVNLYVHTYAGPDNPGVARVEGHGAVTETWVRRVLGPRARFKILPVIDLAGQAPVDAYEIPDRHRQAVHLMTPADTFPFASCTGPSMQVDHTVPHTEGGRSGVGNYGPMTTFHHRVKTHGSWQVKQPFPGIYVWRDPHGAHYLVDHTGTRRLEVPPTVERGEVYLPSFEVVLAA